MKICSVSLCYLNIDKFTSTKYSDDRLELQLLRTLLLLLFSINNNGNNNYNNRGISKGTQFHVLRMIKRKSCGILWHLEKCPRNRANKPDMKVLDKGMAHSGRNHLPALDNINTSKDND